MFRLEVARADRGVPPHFANLMVGRLEQPVWGAPFRTLADLRQILVRDATHFVAEGGSPETRGQILRFGSAPGIRVRDIQIGESLTEQGCIPVRSLSQHRDFPGFPPGSVAEIYGEDRFCVTGDGEAINANFVEVTLQGDRDAAAHGEKARGLARDLFASIRVIAPPASPGPQIGDPVSLAAEHCRLAHGGRYGETSETWSFVDFSVIRPAGDWCDFGFHGASRGAIREESTLWLTERPDPRPSEADQSYRLAVHAFRLGPEGWRRRPDELQRLADLRLSVEALAQRERSGASHVFAPPTFFGPASLASIEVGANLTAPSCVPLRLAHVARERNPIMAPDVVRFRSEIRYCLGRGGVTAELRVMEYWLEGDPRAGRL